MENYPKHPILEFPTDILKTMRKKCNFEKPSDIDTAIDILDSWLKKQHHLTENEFPRDYLERTIITEKGSIERAKVSLDKLCTLRTLQPRFFEMSDARKIYNIIDDTFLHAFLPKLTKENWRVYMLQFNKNEFSTEMLFKSLQLSVIFCEYFKAMDYCDGMVVVSDFTGVDIVHIMKVVNLVDLRQVATIYSEGFHLRLQAIHLISSSKAMELFVNLIKSFLKKKVADRIYVHKTVEDLHKFIPKQILPGDIGGEEKPLRELFVDWIHALSSNENIRFIEELRKFKSVEKNRSTLRFNEQYLGMAGTFRTFTVD